MTKEQIETIRKLAETHDFKGVPIPQLCDLAILGAITRDMWYAEYFQPSAEMYYKTTRAFREAEREWIDNARKEEREEMYAAGRRFQGFV